MEIFVETETGEIFSLNVDPTDLIKFVKARIENKVGIHKWDQILVFNGKHLGNDLNILAEFNIQDKDKLYLVRRTFGAPAGRGGFRVVVRGGGAGERKTFEIRERDWTCSGCLNSNFAWRTECNRCNASEVG